MDAKTVRPTSKDTAFVREISSDINARPKRYREAGEWLDERFGFEARMRRLATNLRRGHCNDQTHWWKQLKRGGCDRAARRQHVLGKRGRLLDALSYYRHKADDWIMGQEDALRICLLTAIVLDPDTDKTGESLTEFQRDWPWGERDDFVWAERVAAGEIENIWRPRWSVWKLMDSQQRRAWLDLAQQAWALVADRGATKTPSRSKQDEPEEQATPETDKSLIWQADAAEFYNIPKSTLSKAAHRSPAEPGYLWSGARGRRRFYRKADVGRLSRSRARLGGM